ncbi:MAG: class I SAM-dependent methyltransferase [Beijerinckiaceae bacterium]
MDRLLEVFLKSIVRFGAVTIQTASGHEFDIGDGSGKPIKLVFRDRAAQARLIRDPALTLGEIYMDGQLDIEGGDVLDLHMAAQRNITSADMSAVLRLADRMRFLARGWKQNNVERRSRSNVAHHYDLDGRLYELFLDPDMQYSCAYYEAPDQTLEEAQIAKKRHIAAKLCIEPGHTVLDIGCGWGGMGLYLAQVCGAKVTGVTLSTEQLAVANKRALAASLRDRAEFRLQDYRHVEERFDRVVSVGMLEHVGANFLEQYFRRVASVLSEGGVALIHTIGRTDGPGVTNPWIAKYIFPGGYIPALSELTAAIEQAGLYLTDLEVLRLHYADTLRDWRNRFMARRDEAKALYDERFCRMWEFYLAGSEASFRIGQNVVFQLQLARRIDAVPVTRDYIARQEADLRQREPDQAAYKMAGE